MLILFNKQTVLLSCLASYVMTCTTALASCRSVISISCICTVYG